MQERATFKSGDTSLVGDLSMPTGGDHGKIHHQPFFWIGTLFHQTTPHDYRASATLRSVGFEAHL
jgi:hypothetical protein